MSEIEESDVDSPLLLSNNNNNNILPNYGSEGDNSSNLRKPELKAKRENANGSKSWFRTGFFNLSPSVYVILPSCVFVLFANIGLVPILPELQVKWFQKCTEIVTNTTNGDDTQPHYHCVPDYENTQHWTGLFDSFQNLIAFCMAPQVGRLSDNIGRKPLMLMASCFSWLPIVSLMLTNTNSAAAFYAVTVSSGLLGLTRAGAMGIINTYVADATARASGSKIAIDKDARTRSFGLIGATSGVSMIATPLIRMLGDSLSNLNLFLGILASFGMLNSLYILFVVPESLHHNLRKLNQKKGPQKSWSPLAPLRLMFSSPILLWVCVVLLLGGTSEAGMGQVALLYINEAYNFSEHDARVFDSYLFAFMGVAVMLSQLVFLRLFLRMKFTHSGIIALAQTANAIHMLWYGALKLFPLWFLFLNVIPIGLTFLSNVTIFSFVSSIAEKRGEEFGISIGTLSAIVGLNGIIGPLAFSQLYATVGKYYPIIPFAVGAVVAFTSAIIAKTALSAEESKFEQLGPALTGSQDFQHPVAGAPLNNGHSVTSIDVYERMLENTTDETESQLDEEP